MGSNFQKGYSERVLWCRRHKKERKTSLPESVLDRIWSRFLELFDCVVALLPPPDTWPRNNKGQPKKPKTLKLIIRLRRGLDAVLRFVSVFVLPFDNKLTERSIRMLKVLQKVFGCFRTEVGARDHLTIRSAFMTAAAKGESNLLLLRQNLAQCEKVEQGQNSYTNLTSRSAGGRISESGSCGPWRGSQ